ncbi:MAG: ACT domain-containing protein [Clostridia bacterium]|nr:ACT domain-containing protein [Clostridia bacterium]
MTINQLSIFIENKEGKLADLTSTLAKENIDIRAMSVADTQDFGILRLIVSDTDRAIAALKETGCIVSVTQVLAISISDTPGSLSTVLRILSDNHISVEYVYAFITRRQEGAYVVFRVADNQAAAELLTKHGVKLATKDDIDAL